MALHDRGLEHAGQHDEVPLGTRGPVEHHPLDRAVPAADEPARQPVREPAGVGQRQPIRRAANDLEQCARLP